MVDASKVKSGDKVHVKTWTNALRQGMVTGTGFKNGTSVIEYRDANGEMWWCYADQVMQHQAA